MNETHAKKVIDALEKAEKIAVNRPALPKELLPSYLRLIDVIYQLSKEGQVRVSDLSNTLKQTAPSITRSLTAMEKLDLIQKNYSEKDKRVVYVSLTKKGNEVYFFYVERYYKKLAERLSKYDSNKLNTMISVIDDLYSDLINDPINMEV